MPDKTPAYKPTDRLTRQEAATVLGLSLSMIDHLRRTRKLSCEKNQITRQVRYLYADLLAYKKLRETAGIRVTGKQPVRRRPSATTPATQHALPAFRAPR